MILERRRPACRKRPTKPAASIDAIQYCDPARPTTFVPMPGNRHRWEFMLMPNDDPAAIIRPERIYELLRPWDIEPAKSSIERAVVYTFHSALSTQWRLGRSDPGGRFRASDAAVPRPGHVLRSARCRQSGVEASRRDPRSSDGPSARHLRDRAYRARARVYRTRGRTGSVIQTTDPEKARQRDHDLIANPTMLRPITPRLGPGLHGDAPPPAARRAAQPRLADGRCWMTTSDIGSRCWRSSHGGCIAGRDTRRA